MTPPTLAAELKRREEIAEQTGVIYAYETTRGGRKTWDGEPDLSKEGWEEYRPWERFDYHEERSWRRVVHSPDVVRALLNCARALERIANDPHQVYDNGSTGSYGIGVADGHRCAGNTARAALGQLRDALGVGE